ncbi:MAG: hypothetical protein QF441_10240 [Bacteriovoracaceae bacterium]|nr:hypothetical protein [Halobacteriovoraceae bacterium]MDP7320978.1 hypothetical protein [Bacteriovoracaceae bacterium]
MNRLSLFLSLVILFGCSSIHFQSSHAIPSSFNYENIKGKEVSLKVTEPFYMWGIVPKERIVEVDKVFVKKGFSSVSDIKIKEIDTVKKGLWMFFTFGMYYPQSFEISGYVN